MNKTINLKDSVYVICTDYPEVKDILAGVGFLDITKPGVLNAAGRLMTLPRGASMRGIELAKVISALQANGFEIASSTFSENLKDERSTPSKQGTDNPENRAERLKWYVTRLSQGEDLEDVKKDFVEHFQSVDAAEIANAEQQLIMNGTPVYDVQRLCDVHSALFHGATREEQIANAELAVQASAEKQRKEVTLADLPGHPVYELIQENKVIEQRLREVKKAAEGRSLSDTLKKLNDFRTVNVHYAEKGDLIYPVLKTKYDVSGPADVMWGVDDEIRDELKVLAEAGETLTDFMPRLEKVLTRAEEMIYKESNILIPLCVQNFTKEDWMKIYYELPSYDNVLVDRREIWQEAEDMREEMKKRQYLTDQKASSITLGSGHMTPAQIEAVLNTIPMELSFIDDHDINRYFNAGKKLFKRPDEAVDREVYACHPPKYSAMARQIINELKNGSQPSVDVWMNKHGEPVLVRYMAVRNEAGEYVGTLECVQKMRFAQEHFQEDVQ